MGNSKLTPCPFICFDVADKKNFDGWSNIIHQKTGTCLTLANPEITKDFKRLVKAWDTRTAPVEKKVMDMESVGQAIEPIFIHARESSLTEKYNELIMAVENKYEGESRHQTALRYIKNAETFRPAVDGKDINYIIQTIVMLNSMVLCGETHKDYSGERVNKAIEIADRLNNQKRIN